MFSDHVQHIFMHKPFAREHTTIHNTFSNVLICNQRDKKTVHET